MSNKKIMNMQVTKDQKYLPISSPALLALQDKIIKQGLTDMTVQSSLATRLRQEAVNHLGTSDTPVANGFRAEYLHTVGDGSLTCHKFLKQQAKPRVWGTYVEAAALGEKYDCSVVVTSINTSSATKETFTLHRATDDKHPIIHLTNRDNQHWQHGGSTIADGNCLYNAFAQAIRAVDARSSKQTPSTPFFSDAAQRRIIASQEALLPTVEKAPTPSQVAAEQLKEQQRFAKLPPHERQQIREDHALALRIAAGGETADMKPADAAFK